MHRYPSTAYRSADAAEKAHVFVDSGRLSERRRRNESAYLFADQSGKGDGSVITIRSACCLETDG